jgi:hypothetical protein
LSFAGAERVLETAEEELEDVRDRGDHPEPVPSPGSIPLVEKPS